MTKDEPLDGDSLRVDLEKTYLAEHLRDCRCGRRKVVLTSGEREGVGVVGVLEVREVDVHDSLQEAESFNPLIPAGVPNQGNRQPPVRSDGESADNMGRPMGRGDEVDVVSPLLLEGDHLVCKLLDPHFYSVAHL